jgi:hypothetical protein
MFKDKRRFFDRVWKRIFRNKTSCDCKDCQDIVNNGVVIHDVQHARWLYTYQCELWSEWIEVNYRDEK